MDRDFEGQRKRRSMYLSRKKLMLKYYTATRNGKPLSKIVIDKSKFPKECEVVGHDNLGAAYSWLKEKGISNIDVSFSAPKNKLDK